MSTARLARAVTVLGLKGAELDTVVNGENWDEPKYLPLFKAAESMGAVLFFHPQHNFMAERMLRRGVSNSLGVIVEDAIVVAALILGGVLDACPGLKACIARGGGPACFAMGRIDRAWRALPEARRSIPEPPSAYQRRLYYDSVAGSEEALRFLLDRVGADRVMLGSDWPFVPWYPSAVTWVEGLASLSRDEKDQIPLAEPRGAAEAVRCGSRAAPCRPTRLYCRPWTSTSGSGLPSGTGTTSASPTSSGHVPRARRALAAMSMSRSSSRACPPPLCLTG